MTVPCSLKVDGHLLSRDERYVAHGALLAQVDDVHAGGVYQWTEHDHEVALSLLSTLTGDEAGPDPMEAPSGYGESLTSRVLVMALLVPVYELDHPDLGSEGWVEADRLLGVLAEEFGR